MTAPSDLIRREDVERIVREAVVDRAIHNSPAIADRPAWAVRNEIAAAIRALPADPVAEAAVRLAEAADWMEDECVGAGLPQYLAANRWTDSEAAFVQMLSAIDAYRAAVAARAKEST